MSVRIGIYIFKLNHNSLLIALIRVIASYTQSEFI